MTLVPVLNNREIASLIWIIVLLVLFQFSKDIRRSLFRLLQSFFAKQLLLCHLLMGAYIAALAYGLAGLGFWKVWMLKDTVIWALFSGFILLFRFAQTDQNKPLSIKAVLLDNLKLIVVFEFIVNIISFALWIEILLLPSIVFVVLLVEVSKLRKEHRKTQIVFEWLQVIIGLTILFFSAKEVFSSTDKHMNLETFQSFILPFIMTIAFLPFLYLVGLYSRYEIVFMRLEIWNKDAAIVKKAKCIILKSCHLNLSKIDKLSTPSGVSVFQAKSVEEIRDELRKVTQ